MTGSLSISLVIREELKVVPGGDPITILFPNIKNYNSELDSGPISVRTMYDNVVLDDSGDSETNRKATTGLDAYLMASNTNYKVFFSHNFNITFDLLFIEKEFRL
jgi:hypothetical protein